MIRAAGTYYENAVADSEAAQSSKSSNRLLLNADKTSRMIFRLRNLPKSEVTRGPISRNTLGFTNKINARILNNYFRILLAH